MVLTRSCKKPGSPKDNSLMKEIPQSKGGGVLLYDGEGRALTHSREKPGSPKDNSLMEEIP
eukprot:2048134-Ditylum_brightwellii.AAC.1